MPIFEHEHSREAIRARLAGAPGASYLRDSVYGGIDGTVTTFAVVAGASGAALEPRIVVILGIVNLLADGFSMAAGNYSGTKTEVDDHARLAAVESRHIDLVPEGEREEIRQIFANKGLGGPGLEEAVHAITSNRAVWIETMLSEEYGLARTPRSPIRAALATFLAFVACGAVPLLPFALGLPTALATATAAAALVFFAIGSAKARWSLTPWWRSGLETLAIGTAAAGLAYLAGDLLGRIV